ncbi:MAG: methyltransferase domain-containing protein [Candidatus Latescibacterota bacterium]|nr:MAG: methyltransferase domain-containing protein [Candidatus Latescibacterota bacterium]
MSSPESWYVRAFDDVYLEVYAHRDADEAERVTHALLEPLGLRGRRVLDLACGAGRYTRALAARGARVVGLDLSSALLNSALESTHAGAAFVRGDMLRLPLRSASCHLVLSMFTSFGYLATSDEDQAMLGEVRRVLRDDGCFLLDFFNAARVRRTLVPETRRRAGRFDVLERRSIDASTNSVVKEIELRSGGKTYAYREVVRLWSRPQLEKALCAAGLRVDRVWGDYEASAFDPEESERLLLLARSAPLPG